MENQFIKTKVENWLAKYFENKGSYNKAIYQSMYYSLEVGGKRIRPILHLLTYNLYKDDYDNVIPIACALEMIHTYSLIHDDLPCMDNDDLRRGKPTNHKIYGEGVAVLAGDALLNEAVNIMMNYCINKTQKELIACKLICEASGADGMIGGQIVDILSEGRVISNDELSYMHRKKTGELIKAAILSGAIIGGANEEDIKALGSFGEKLGLAFQIKDDILDVIGTTEKLGKKINSDTNNEKCTFITMFGLEDCIEKCTSLTNECINILKSLKRDTNNLEELTLFLLKREI